MLKSLGGSDVLQHCGVNQTVESKMGPLYHQVGDIADGSDLLWGIGVEELNGRCHMMAY